LELHKATAHTVTVGEKEFSGVRSSLGALRKVVMETEQVKVCDTIESLLERELLGQRLPLVWSHGDAGSNYLEGRDGELAGIIDWETSDRNGFPLHDWVLLCVGRSKRAKRGQGWASLRLTLSGEQSVFFQELPVEGYLAAFDLDRRLIPALAISAWVRYVADRLPERGCDPDWLRATVLKVLRVCSGLL